MRNKNLKLIFIFSLILFGCSSNIVDDSKVTINDKLTTNKITLEDKKQNKEINLKKDDTQNNDSPSLKLQEDPKDKQPTINTKPNIKKEDDNLKPNEKLPPPDNISNNNKPKKKPVINDKSDKNKVDKSDSSKESTIINDDTNNKDKDQATSSEPIDKPKENSPDQDKKDESNILCSNALFDESKPCDYIPDNLKPTDELGREVPLFKTSQEAWDFGEAEINNPTSKYNCLGFTRMSGFYNNGEEFFFAYLKVCSIN